MTIYDEAWVERMEAEFKRLEAEGLYHPEQEHASCGVGLVVAIDGKPRRQVVESAIKALKAIWHRGAVDADGKTGDGAGIHVQIPVGLLRGPGAAHRAPAARRAAGGRAGVPAAKRLRRTGGGADDRRDRSPAHGILYLWLAARAGRYLGARAEGQRDAARDRADPDLELQGRRRGDLRARALRHPAADREGGGGHPRLLRLLDELPVGDLQGDDAGRGGQRLLPGPAGPALRLGLRDLSPAVFDQHLPAVVAGAAVPDARPQRRDQHAEGQPQLAAEPRDPHELGLFRRARRGHQADRPAGVVELGGARQRLRGAGPRRADRADGEVDAGARGLVEARDQDAAELAGHVRLFERGDGALGRTGRPRDDRRSLGVRRARPQRPPADALRRDRRRAGDGRVGGRHGADRRPDRGREGCAGAGAAARRRHGRGQALPRRRDQGSDGRLAALRRVGGLDHRPRGGRGRHRGDGALRRRRAPPPADRRRLFDRGARDRARRDGRGRQGGHRLDGRRHAARGALDQVPAAQPLLPPELQPGDQPADRLACASIG